MTIQCHHFLKMVVQLGNTNEYHFPPEGSGSVRGGGGGNAREYKMKKIKKKGRKEEDSDDESSHTGVQLCFTLPFMCVIL